MSYTIQLECHAISMTSSKCSVAWNDAPGMSHEMSVLSKCFKTPVFYFPCFFRWGKFRCVVTAPKILCIFLKQKLVINPMWFEILIIMIYSIIKFVWLLNWGAHYVSQMFLFYCFLTDNSLHSPKYQIIVCLEQTICNFAYVSYFDNQWNGMMTIKFVKPPFYNLYSWSHFC